MSDLHVSVDRRVGQDRRRGQRRGSGDRRTSERRRGRRRRETPTPYTAEQDQTIQQAHATPRTRPQCPTCAGAFTLGPARRRGSDVVRQIRCVSCGKTTTVTNPRTARVLVVAERNVVRDAVRTVLTAAGHEVVEVADAGVALSVYGMSHVDVVFVDLHGPGKMDAGDFIRLLKREHPGASIVAMSARRSYGVSDPAALAKQLGATASLRVPCSRTDMLEVLEEARAW